MHLRQYLLFAFFAIFTLQAKGAVLLTNFGNTGPQAFSIDNGYTTFATTPGTSSLQISGSDLGSTLFGSFFPVSIVQSDKLTLTGNITSPPNSAFTVTLYDSLSYDKSARYTGGSWTNLSGAGATLSLDTSNLTAGFNFGNISAMFLETAGLTGTINASLTGLSAGAVPEPGRFLLLMMGLVSLTTRRRRRA